MKKILIFSLTALLPLVMMADDITIAEATRIAQEFDLTQRHKAQKTATPQTQQSVQWLTSRIEDGTPLYHIFNRGTGGYVIVSGDDAVRPVLAYSDQNALTAVGDIPPAMQRMLDLYAGSMKAIKRGRAQGYIIDDTDIPQPTTAVSPMIQTKWGQGAPYNQMCPSYNARCITGCVATAMAQLMYFYKHPAQGTGQHSYIWNERTLSADFSSHTYDWDNMLLDYSGSSTTTQKKAVAQLMSDCGISVEANYGANLTEAHIYRQFVDYFGYDSSSAWMYKYNRSNVQWEQIINEELLKGHPVYYCARNDDDSMGHLFIIDGCDNKNYYHINWGWDGKEDGYFTITFPDHLGTYWDSACCIIGLQPGTEDAAEDFTVALPYTFNLPLCTITADAQYNWFFGNFTNHSTQPHDVQHGAQITNATTGETFLYEGWTEEWAAKEEYEYMYFDLNDLELEPGDYDIEPLYRIDGEGEWKHYRPLRDDITPARLTLLGNVAKSDPDCYLAAKPELYNNTTMSRNSDDYITFYVQLCSRNSDPEVLIMGVQLTDLTTHEVEYVPCYRILLTNNGLNFYYDLHARKFSHAGNFRAVLAYRDAHYGSEWKLLRYGNTLARFSNITVTGESDMKLLVEDMGVGDDTGISSMPLTARYRVRALEDAEATIHFDWALGSQDEPVSMKQGEVREFTYTNYYPDLQPTQRYYITSVVQTSDQEFYNNLFSFYFIDDTTPVQSVAADDEKWNMTAPMDVFTLSGMRLRGQTSGSTVLQSLPRGTYLLRQGTKTRKIQLK